MGSWDRTGDPMGGSRWVHEMGQVVHGRWKMVHGIGHVVPWEGGGRWSMRWDRWSHGRWKMVHGMGQVVPWEVAYGPWDGTGDPMGSGRWP